MNKIIGYRNNTLSTIGADRLLLADIVDYETLDLGNSDIPDYVQHTYPEWQLNPSMTGKDIEQIIRRLWHLPKTAKLYGIWLTKTKRDVAAYYADESPNITITTYVLPQTALVVSNLGPEGLLYVIPKPSDAYYANEKTYLLSKTGHLIDPPSFFLKIALSKPMQT